MAHVVMNNGTVTGVFANPQPDMPGHSEIDDGDPRIAAFLTPGKPKSITATQFLNRLPAASLPVLFGNPATGVMLITLAAAEMIDLTDPAVVAGINGLVPAILTAQQAAAVLDH